MPNITIIALALLLLSRPGPGAPGDPCRETSSTPDVRFALALKDDRAVFQEGEIIPLVLSFSSTAKNRYWADVRIYDRLLPGRKSERRCGRHADLQTKRMFCRLIRLLALSAMPAPAFVAPRAATAPSSRPS